MALLVPTNSAGPLLDSPVDGPGPAGNTGFLKWRIKAARCTPTSGRPVLFGVPRGEHSTVALTQQFHSVLDLGQPHFLGSRERLAEQLLDPSDRRGRYLARLPQDWITVNVVPQRPGSWSSASASSCSRASSSALTNSSNRGARPVVIWIGNRR